MSRLYCDCYPTTDLPSVLLPRTCNQYQTPSTRRQIWCPMGLRDPVVNCCGRHFTGSPKEFKSFCFPRLNLAYLLWRVLVTTNTNTILQWGYHGVMCTHLCLQFGSSPFLTTSVGLPFLPPTIVYFYSGFTLSLLHIVKHKPQLLVFHNGGSDHQPKSVRHNPPLDL